ncbi:MAG: tetratricopeptide repeat protein [Thermoplasmata archaeon]
MGRRGGWLGVSTVVALAILLAAPAAALDANVGWSLENAPAVVTLAATDISADSALLQGSLTDLGGEASIQVSFEWGTSPAALGRETAPQTLSAPSTFEATVGNLEPETTYYYRAKAAGNGTATGEVLDLQTAPAALAGDLFSQIWLWLVVAAVGAVMGFLLTRRQLAARRKPGEPGAAGQKTRKAKTARGRLLAKAEVPAVSKEAPVAAAVGLGVAAGAPISEILCPHCGSQLAETAVYCYGCGRGLTEGVDLEERVERAKGALAANERDRDALFTVGAHLAAAGEAKEAIEILNKLTMLDPHYPGLWWVKARVFEALGNAQAAEAAMMRAMQDDQSSGVEALLTAAGTAGVAATAPTPAPTPPKSEEAQERADEKTAPETCPDCSAPLELEAGNCPNCGHSVLDRGEALEAKVTRALAILDLDENDTDALFTLGAYLLLDGKFQESMETLNRLALLDPSYPGLWWVKAQVFEKLGNKQAAESAIARAQQGDEDLNADHSE